MSFLDEVRAETKRPRRNPVRDEVEAVLADDMAEIEEALTDTNITTAAIVRVINKRMVKNGSELRISENTIRRWRKELGL